jgi:hypothetical protein
MGYVRRRASRSSHAAWLAMPQRWRAVAQGVRVYDVGTNSVRSQFRQEGPVLCAAFVEPGAVLAGGLDTHLVR